MCIYVYMHTHMKVNIYVHIYSCMYALKERDIYRYLDIHVHMYGSM